MHIFSFFNRTHGTRGSRRKAQRPQARPTLEQFEDRVVPAVTVVGNTGAFTSLQAAIAAAASGDTLIIQANNAIAQGTGSSTTTATADAAAG